MEDSDKSGEISSSDAQATTKRRDAKRERKSNKQRAKEFRDRKRTYYEDMELKNKALEDEIRVLRCENQRLKTIIEFGNLGNPNNDVKTLEQRVQIQEQFALNELPVIMKSNKDEVWFEMIKNIKLTIGNFGTDRVKLIKEAFRIIIDNVVPLDTKTTITCFDKVSVKKWISLAKAQSTITKNKYKKPDPESTDYILNLLKNLSYSEVSIHLWENAGNEFKKELDNMRVLMKRLIKTRNLILNQMKSLHNFFSNYISTETVTLQDFINQAELTNCLKGSEQFKAVNIWGVPAKESTSDEYVDDEISEQ